jgi:hypothetical protein
VINLLDLLCSYLADRLELVPGDNIVYNEIPDQPDSCVVLQEERSGRIVPPQINAAIHYVRVVVRAETNSAAFSLAQLCWRWLLTDSAEIGEDTTGFLTLLDGTVIHCQLLGTPVWEQADQQGRKYFCFYALITTKQ